MIEVPRSLLLMHPDRLVRARVNQVAKRDFAVEVPSSWGELTGFLRTASPVSIAVVDPYNGSGNDAHLAPELQALLRDFPFTAVIAVVEVRPDRFADLCTLGNWGVAEVLSAEDGNPALIGRALRSARGRPLQSLLESSLPARTSGRARSILNTAAEIASTGGQPKDLARELYASERTLLRWCTAVGLPTPRELLVWMRVLLAAELLEEPGRNVANVAGACGYASASGLRRALCDSVEMNPSELRKKGAFATASRAFRGALAAKRRKRRKSAASARVPGKRKTKLHQPIPTPAHHL